MDTSQSEFSNVQVDKSGGGYTATRNGETFHFSNYNDIIEANKQLDQGLAVHLYSANVQGVNGKQYNYLFTSQGEAQSFANVNAAAVVLSSVQQTSGGYSANIGGKVYTFPTLADLNQVVSKIQSGTAFQLYQGGGETFLSQGEGQNYLQLHYGAAYHQFANAFAYRYDQLNAPTLYYTVNGQQFSSYNAAEAYARSIGIRSLNALYRMGLLNLVTAPGASQYPFSLSNGRGEGRGKDFQLTASEAAILTNFESLSLPDQYKAAEAMLSEYNKTGNVETGFLAWQEATIYNNNVPQAPQFVAPFTQYQIENATPTVAAHMKAANNIARYDFNRNILLSNVPLDIGTFFSESAQGYENLSNTPFQSAVNANNPLTRFGYSLEAATLKELSGFTNSFAMLFGRSNPNFQWGLNPESFGAAAGFAVQGWLGGEILGGVTSGLPRVVGITVRAVAWGGISAGSSALSGRGALGDIEAFALGAGLSAGIEAAPDVFSTVRGARLFQNLRETFGLSFRPEGDLITSELTPTYHSPDVEYSTRGGITTYRPYVSSDTNMAKWLSVRAQFTPSTLQDMAGRWIGQFDYLLKEGVPWETRVESEDNGLLGKQNMSSRLFKPMKSWPIFEENLSKAEEDFVSEYESSGNVRNILDTSRGNLYTGERGYFMPGYDVGASYSELLGLTEGGKVNVGAWANGVNPALYAQANIAARKARISAGANLRNFSDFNTIAINPNELSTVVDPTIKPATWIGNNHKLGSPLIPAIGQDPILIVPTVDLNVVPSLNVMPRSSYLLNSQTLQLQTPISQEDFQPDFGYRFDFEYDLRYEEDTFNSALLLPDWYQPRHKKKHKKSKKETFTYKEFENPVNPNPLVKFGKIPIQLGGIQTLSFKYEKRKRRRSK